MRSRDATGRRRERGAAIVEFMLVLPILLSLAFAVWEFGRLIDVLLVATNAAREGARAVTVVGKFDDQGALVSAGRGRAMEYLQTGLGSRLGPLVGGTCASGDVCLDPNDIVVQFRDENGDPATPAPFRRVEVTVPVRARVFQNYIPGLFDPFILTGRAEMQL